LDCKTELITSLSTFGKMEVSSPRAASRCCDWTSVLCKEYSKNKRPNAGELWRASLNHRMEWRRTDPVLLVHGADVPVRHHRLEGLNPLHDVPGIMTSHLKITLHQALVHQGPGYQGSNVKLACFFFVRETPSDVLQGNRKGCNDNQIPAPEAKGNEKRGEILSAREIRNGWQEFKKAIFPKTTPFLKRSFFGQWRILLGQWRKEDQMGEWRPDQ